MTSAIDEFAVSSEVRDEAGFVAAARSGDERAFRILVEGHYRYVYRFLLKHAITAAEAEELTQDVFLQAYRAIGRFRGDSRFDTWLIGIALNVVRNYTRRSPWRLIEADVLPDGDVPAPAEASTHDPHYRACIHAAVDAVAAALGRLPPEMRESLMLIAIEDLPYEEAATLLGEPVGTVKSRVSRARELLRRHIDRCHLEALAGKT